MSSFGLIELIYIRLIDCIFAHFRMVHIYVYESYLKEQCASVSKTQDELNKFVVEMKRK